MHEHPQQQEVVETTTRSTTTVETNTFQETGDISNPSNLAKMSKFSVSELTPPLDFDTLPTASPDFATTTLFSTNQLQIADQKTMASCDVGQIPRFLKTSDFELHNHDDMRLEGVSLNECIDFCSTNFAVRVSSLEYC